MIEQSIIITNSCKSLACWFIPDLLPWDCTSHAQNLHAEIICLHSCITYLHTQCQELLDESQWVIVMTACHCYLWWRRRQVWHFVSSSHKVMTAAIVMLCPDCCCGGFSAMAQIHTLHCYLWWRKWWSDTLWASLSDKAMTALVVMLCSDCHSGDFSAISWIVICLYTPTNHFELMKSVCSHGSSSMLFVMKKVMVWHFESNSHKVMTAFSVMLASNWCLGGFSAIS